MPRIFSAVSFLMAEADFISILLSKPKLRTLNKYHDLSIEWYFLGAELEVDSEELNKIEKSYTNDRMRMIKSFGVWLEKGENPTYRRLIKALVDIDKKDIAQSICKDLGKQGGGALHRCLYFHPQLGSRS